MPILYIYILQYHIIATGIPLNCIIGERTEKRDNREEKYKITKTYWIILQIYTLGWTKLLKKS